MKIYDVSRQIQTQYVQWKYTHCNIHIAVLCAKFLAGFLYHYNDCYDNRIFCEHKIFCSHNIHYGLRFQVNRDLG